MTDANYQKHFKVIGKMTLLYDYPGEAEATLELYASALYDQTWTGAQPSYDAGILLNPYAASLATAIASAVNATTARKDALIAMCRAYIQNSVFCDDLTTTPTANTAAACCTALQFDLVADNKTMTTEAATGMVNFLDTACSPTGGPSGGWNTEADVTADYKDSVYVVSGQI